MLFIFICILAMWLMIFGVGCLYAGMLTEDQVPPMLHRLTLSLLVASLVWLGGAYFLAYEGRWISLFSDADLSAEKGLDLCFQLCFCLYAVVMLIGAGLDRVRLTGLLLLVPAWILLVYVPLVYLIWKPDGSLAQRGVLDFAGGIVVHLSAGVSSYVLAYFLGPASKDQPSRQPLWSYLGTMLVTLGWFGFNAGPAQGLNALAVAVLLKTLLAIIAGGLAWQLHAHYLTSQAQLEDVLNGMVVGLVTSTTAVGYVGALAIFCLTFVAAFLTALALPWLKTHLAIDDAVDSFGMNAIGGGLGCLGLIICQPQLLVPELTAVLITLILSTTVTAGLCRLLKKLL